MRRRLIVGAFTAASALGIAAGLGVLSAAADEDGRYVAMGDSYSSGAEIAPLTTGVDPRCSRSERSYAHVLVARTSLDGVTDVTCSGARTQHFRTSQHPGVPPQMRALSDKTRLVTMTIGANDERVFGTSIFSCNALSAKDPNGNPCERHFGHTFQRAVREQTYPNLVRTLTEVRAAAPHAQVAVVGYPHLLPGTASPACSRVTRIAQGDLPYLGAVHAGLNNALRRAARVAGATYVDMSHVSVGHDMCQPAERRWVEPFAPINAAAFHPNSRGEAAMATQIIERLGLRS